MGMSAWLHGLYTLVIVREPSDLGVIVLGDIMGQLHVILYNK